MSIRIFIAFGLALAIAAPAPAAPPQATHHVRKTDSGCLYYFSAVWDRKTEAKAVSGLVAKWDGSPCTPGVFINGFGSITEYDDQVWATVGHKPDPYVNKTIGRLNQGAWDGEIQQISGPAASPSRNRAKFVMSGGCQVMPNGAVNSNCQPISPGGRGATYPSSQPTSNEVAAGPNASGGVARPSRIIARDGQSAMDCVKLVELTKSDSSTGGGGRVLSNQCGNTVEIGWCYVGGDCESTGSQTNVAVGRSWPVSAEKEIRWAACHGANTFHSDPGSKGLRFTCSAPVQ